MSTSRWSLVSRFAPNSLPGAESPSQQVEVPHGSTMPQEGLEELGLKLWPWWASKDRGKQGHTFNLMCCAGVPNNFTRLLTNTQFFSLSIAKSREREREREKVKQKERKRSLPKITKAPRCSSGWPPVFFEVDTWSQSNANRLSGWRDHHEESGNIRNLSFFLPINSSKEVEGYSRVLPPTTGEASAVGLQRPPNHSLKALGSESAEATMTSWHPNSTTRISNTSSLHVFVDCS